MRAHLKVPVGSSHRRSWALWREVVFQTCCVFLLASTASVAAVSPVRVSTAAELNEAIGRNTRLIEIVNHIDIRELPGGRLDNPSLVGDMAIWGNCEVTDDSFESAKKYAGIPADRLAPGSTACGIIVDTWALFIRNSARLYLANLVIHSPYPTDASAVPYPQCETAVSTIDSSVWLVGVIIAGCQASAVLSYDSNIMVVDSVFVRNNLPLIPSPAAWGSAPGGRQWNGDTIKFYDNANADRNNLIISNSTILAADASAPSTLLKKGPVYVSIGNPYNLNGTQRVTPNLGQQMSIVIQFSAGTFDGSSSAPPVGCANRGLCVDQAAGAQAPKIFTDLSPGRVSFQKGTVAPLALSALQWGDLNPTSATGNVSDQQFFIPLVQENAYGAEKAYNLFGFSPPMPPSPPPPPPKPAPPGAPAFFEVVTPVPPSRKKLAKSTLVILIAAVIAGVLLIAALVLYLVCVKWTDDEDEPKAQEPQLAQCSMNGSNIGQSTLSRQKSGAVSAASKDRIFDDARSSVGAETVPMFTPNGVARSSSVKQDRPRRGEPPRFYLQSKP